MPHKARYEAGRAWRIGTAEGLTQEYVLVPGQVVEIADEDLGPISKALGPGRKLAQLKQTQAAATTPETRAAEGGSQGRERRQKQQRDGDKAKD